MIDPSILVHKHIYEVVKQIAQVAKYVFGAATTALGIFSIIHKTTYESDQPEARKKLTRAGRRYLASIVVLAFATIIFSAAGDLADSRLSQISSYFFQAEVRTAVEAENKKLAESLQPAIDNLNNQVTQAGKKVQDLNEITSAVSRDVARSGAEIKMDLKTTEKKMITSSELGLSRTQRILEQADLPVKYMRLELVYDGSSISQTRDVDVTQKDGLLAAKYKECNTAHDNGHEERQDCGKLFHAWQAWQATRVLARTLNPTGKLMVQIRISLRAFTVILNDEDCSKELLLNSPEPCIKATIHAARFDFGDQIPMYIAPALMLKADESAFHLIPEKDLPCPAQHCDFRGADLDLEKVDLSGCSEEDVPRQSGPPRKVDSSFLDGMTFRLYEQGYVENETKSDPTKVVHKDYVMVATKGRSPNSQCFSLDMKSN